MAVDSTTVAGRRRPCSRHQDEARSQLAAGGHRAVAALECFQAKWIPVGEKKTRQNKKIEPRSDSIGTEKALGFRKGSTDVGLGGIGHRSSRLLPFPRLGTLVARSPC